MTSDFKPLRETPLITAISDHHSWTEFVQVQFVGCRDSSPSQKDKAAQIRLVNLQSTKRWFPVSGQLRQSEQVGLCGQPLALSLSAVQILSCTASQLKNLHFGGAQADQMIWLKLVLIAPWNCAWLAELVENWPDSLNFQQISSWMCGVRFTLWTVLQSCTNSMMSCAEKDGCNRSKSFIQVFLASA